MKTFSYNPDVIDSKLQKAITLRQLYSDSGYIRYTSNKFERYDFYSKHKDFLVCKNIISFSDTDGTLMALSPDMTLSIINSSQENLKSANKLYYDEDIYRVSEFTGKFRCYRQVGLECFGKLENADIDNVIVLALSTLSVFNEKFVLAISDVNIIVKLIKLLDLSDLGFQKLLELIRSKNIDEINGLLKSEKVESEKASLFLSFLQLDELTIDSCIKEGSRICSRLGASDEFDVFCKFVDRFKKTEYFSNIQIDFSQIGDVNYYSGVCFNGFVPEIGEVVLKGGQYDHILSKLSKSGNAIGFAVYLDRILCKEEE